jgi:hypothetical protein
MTEIQQNTLYLLTPASYINRDHLTLQVSEHGARIETETTSESPCPPPGSSVKKGHQPGAP